MARRSAGMTVTSFESGVVGLRGDISEFEGGYRMVSLIRFVVVGTRGARHG